MTALTAPLAPESYALDPAPIGDRAWIEHEIARAFADLHATVRICPECPAVGRERCREDGRFCGTHPGRAG